MQNEPSGQDSTAKVPLRRVRRNSPSGVFIAADYMRVACPKCQFINTIDRAAGGSPTRCGGCQEFFIAPRERFGEGAVLGDYVIGRKLGEGAMGTVYTAHQRSLDRPCAIKVLNDKYRQDRDLAAALVREAQTAARLSHPNIVSCFAVGREDGTVYYAMERVEGQTLAEMLARQPRMPVAMATDIIIQVASALEHAWSREQMVHQDIKPDNIIVKPDYEAKLADMGMARPTGSRGSLSSPALNSRPGYMSPEQATGQDVDLRSDIFSLGVVFFRALTGKSPFGHSTPEIILQKLRTEELPDPRSVAPDLSKEVAETVLKMVRLNPQERYQDYATLLRDLAMLRASESASGPLTYSRASSTTTRRLSESGALITPLPSAPKPATVRLVPVLVGVALLLAAGTAAFIGLRPDAPVAPGLPKLRITQILPDPDGFDGGKEWVEITNDAASPVANLSGWSIRVETRQHPLAGTIKPGETRRIVFDGSGIALANQGATITLNDPTGSPVQTVTYTETQIGEGMTIQIPAGS